MLPEATKAEGSPDVTVTVGAEPVIVELTELVPAANRPREELRSDLLTRVQWSNNRKAMRFREGKMPCFVENALAELDSLWYE